MRLRTKKNLEPRIEKCAHLLLDEPTQYKGKWKETFGGKEVRLEIGCGKGSFITQLAEKSPDINFIAIEKCLDVAVLAMEKTVAKIDTIRDNEKIICVKQQPFFCVLGGTAYAGAEGPYP